jgi:2-isopropylmalate synthase
LWHQDGTILREASVGDGPVDAVFKAIERITGLELTLRDYRIRSVSVGEDALGEASVEAEWGGKVVSGRAVSTDIIEASALAFLQVINRVSLRRQYLAERIRPTEAPPAEPAAPRTQQPAAVS